MALLPGIDSSQGFESLNELYQEIIVEHARRPRGKGRPTACRFCQDGKNPLCGDHITLYCEVNEPSDAQTLPLLRVSFDGTGCSISQASASMLCDSVKNMTVPVVREMIAKAEGIYTGRVAACAHDDLEEDIEALAGVSKFPVRVKCAALAWKSLEILLQEHFDENGRIKSCEGCCQTTESCNKRKLKIVSTENN